MNALCAMNVTAGTSTWKLKTFASKVKVPVAMVGSLLGGTSAEPVRVAWNWIVPWACAWRAQASRGRMGGRLFIVGGTGGGVKTRSRLRSAGASGHADNARAGIGLIHAGQ